MREKLSQQRKRNARITAVENKPGSGRIPNVIQALLHVFTMALQVEMNSLSQQDALMQSLSRRFKVIGTAQLVTGQIKNLREREIFKCFEDLARCPIILWTREFAKNNAKHQWSVEMSKPDAFLCLPKLFAMISANHPDIDLSGAKIAIYSNLFNSDLLDNFPNTEAIEREFEQIFLDQCDHWAHGLTCLQMGYLCKGKKSANMLEKFIRVIGDKKGFARLLQLCDADQFPLLKMLVRILVNKKPVNVIHGIDLIESARFIPQQEQQLQLRGVQHRDFICDQMNKLVLDEKMRPDPYSGYLMISASATVEDVKYISKLYKIAICFSLPVFRVCLDEKEYKRAEELLESETTSERFYAFHQSFVDAIDEVTEDITAHYCFCAKVFAKKDADKLPAKLLEAISESPDIAYKLRFFIFDNINLFLEKSMSPLPSLRVNNDLQTDSLEILVDNDHNVIVTVKDNMSKEYYSTLLTNLTIEKHQTERDGIMYDRYSSDSGYISEPEPSIDESDEIEAENNSTLEAISVLLNYDTTPNHHSYVDFIRSEIERTKHTSFKNLDNNFIAEKRATEASRIVGNRRNFAYRTEKLPRGEVSQTNGHKN